MRITLSDLTPEERNDYVGWWCEVEIKPGVLCVYEGAFLGGRVKIPIEVHPLYASPEQIVIRTDLRPAWNPDGTPLEVK